MARVNRLLGFAVLFFISPFAFATITGLTLSNVPNVTYQAGTSNNIVLKLVLQDGGSGDVLNALAVYNSSAYGATYDASEPAAIKPGGLKLWLDADGNTTSGMSLLGSFTVNGSNPRAWALTGLNQPVSNDQYLIVTFDAQSSLPGMRALQFHVAANAAIFTSGNFPPVSLVNTDTQFLSVQTQAQNFGVSLVSDILSPISLGAADVALATWRFESDPSPGHEMDASTSVRNIRIYFDDGTGPLVPSDVISAVHVLDPDSRTVYLDKNLQGNSAYIAAHQNPALGSLDLDLTVNGISDGLLLSPGYPASLQLLVDLKPSVTAGQMRIRIDGNPDFLAFDSISGSPVTALASPSFPLQTSLALIQAAADKLHALFGSPASLTEVFRGDRGTTILTMVFSNPGSANTGDAQVKTVSFSMVDELDQPIVPNTLLSRARFDDGFNTYLNKPVNESTGNTVVLPLAFPVNVGVSAPVTAYLRVDLKPDAIPHNVRFRIEDLSTVTLWKAIQANTSPEVVIQSFGNTPFASALLPVAALLQARAEITLPPSLYQGQTGLPVMNLVLTNPGSVGTGDFVLDTLRLHLRDENGNPRNASAALSGAALRVGSILPAQTFSTGTDTFTLSLTQGVTIPPAASVTLSISVDLSASVPGTGMGFSLDSSADLTVTLPSDPGRVARTSASYPLSTRIVPILGSTLDRSFTNHPNPFHAGLEETTFSFYLPSPATVTLRVYTLTGEPVRTLLDHQAREAGAFSIPWNGKNGKDQIVRNGIYVAVIETEGPDGKKRERRMVAVKK